MPAHQRFLLLAAIVAVAIATSVGCAKPQMMSIETSPPGAAISVDGGYVGRSPIQLRLRGVKKLKEMKVVAELEKHDRAAKVVEKAKNGRFPKQVFLMLSETQAPASGSGGMGMQQGGTTTTVQGPTIVIPNMGPAPAPYQPQYPQQQQPYPPQYPQQYPQQQQPPQYQQPPPQQQPYPAQYPQQAPQYQQPYPPQQPQYQQPLQRGLGEPEAQDEESQTSEESEESEE